MKKSIYFQQYFSGNKLQVIACLLLILIGNLLNVILPISIGGFYELVLENQTTKGRVLEYLFPLPNTLTLFFLFFIILVVLKAVSVFLEKYVIGLIGEQFSMLLRQNLFNAQLNQTYTAFKRKKEGKYLLRYSGDMLVIQNLITKGGLVFIGDVFFLIFAFTILFLIHAGLTFFVALVFSIGLLVIYALGIYIKRIASDRRNRRSVLLNFVSERLSSFYTIKSFNKEKVESKRFLKQNKGLFRRGIKYQKVNAFILAIEPLFYYGAVVGVFILYIAQPVRFSIRVSELMVFVLVLIYMQSAIKRILKVPVIWQNGKVSLVKLHELISGEKEERTFSEKLVKTHGHIRFENVSYSFPDEKTALVNTNLELVPGKITCIKGNGKSTLFMLIQKIVDPQGGSIFMDKHNYTELSPFEIRKQVAIISESVPLLGKTVFEAITYSPNEERRKKAIHVLDLLGFECSQNNQLLEGPVSHSASEQFLLKIARAILTGKKIILMELPFHLLHMEQMKILVEVFMNMKEDKTIVVGSEMLPTGFPIDQTIYL